LGVLFFDLWRYFRGLIKKNHSWIFLCNRYERLLVEPDCIGVHCDWQWTSDLHAPKVFPFLGLCLMKRALEDYPIILSGDDRRPCKGLPPDVTFIIGHRGIERLPLLLLTLQTIAAQIDVRLECIVVEQSVRQEISEVLPSWVRYVHTPLSHSAMPYCRSWAFNVGARLARGHLLVLHDNDLLIPQRYAIEHLLRQKDGYQAINLKRFIFYISEAHTNRIVSGVRLVLDEAPIAIMQNSEGGGSCVIQRDAFFAIGGFDEAFVGWGGEDNEFWDRAQTLKVYPYGYFPIIHLWHATQAGKGEVNGMGRQTAELFERRMAIPCEQRIKELGKRDFGDPNKLDPPYVFKN